MGLMRRISRRVAAAVFVVLLLTIPALAAAGSSHPGKVTLLPDHEFYASLSAGIRQAKKEIKGCFFLFKATSGRNNLPNELVEDLIAARKRGVAVTMELEQDALGRGSIYEQNRRAAALLSEGGVKVRFDAPKTTTHIKALVIDGRFVYMGSHNLTQSALRYNNELSVMIESKELADEVGSYLDHL